MKMKNISSRAVFWICIGVTVTLILLTRGLTIAHNIYLHPDEYVFYRSTAKLIDFMQGKSEAYEPVRLYPEGTFVFHVPFQWICRLISPNFDLQLSSRIASVVFYTVGVIFGFLLLRKFFGNSLRTFVIYGTTAVLALFHLEQSRYGTSDPLSFMLLMMLLFFGALVYEQKKRWILRLILESFQIFL